MSDEPFRVQQIDHVELFVPDRREAAEWYGRVFGLEVVPEFEFWADDEGGPLMVGTAQGRTLLALFKGAPPRAEALVGFRRVAFRVDGEGFLQFLDRLASIPLYKASGARLTRADVVDHAQSWSVYFVDPYGHPFEITTYDYDLVAGRV
jgi:catechol 2,3-dioxygenase-like lactoylglutathione lyase family enzyme